MFPEISSRRFVVGAATNLESLPQHAEWIVSGNRDLELSDTAFPTLLDAPDQQAQYTEKVNALLEGHTGRRGVHGPFFGMSIGTPDPIFQEQVARRFNETIRFASTFGATHMVIHSPFMGWINPQLFSEKGPMLDMQIDWIRRTLDPVIPVAEEHGLTLMIENIRDLNIYPLLQTVQTIDHPNVRLSLDVGHAQLHVPVGGMLPDHYVREAGDLLGHIHLQDNDAESDRHWAPGDGVISFKAIFDALRLTNADPRLILEVKEIERGAAHLEAIGVAE